LLRGNIKMERNKLFIQPFEFNSFLDRNWSNFLSKILSEAHYKAEDAAYSMGGGEAPPTKHLPGKYDAAQKYLSQFHPGAMAHAMHRRLGADLLRIGQHYDIHKELPEDMDRADYFDVEDKRPGKTKDEDKDRTLVKRYKYILSDILNDEEYAGLDEDQKKEYDAAMADSTRHTQVQDPDTKEMVNKLMLRIYSGHSHLAKRLSSPAKITSNQHESPNSKFKPGIGLQDLVMIDKEGNVIGEDHPDYPQLEKQVEEYLAAGHGLYDFDLSDVTLVPREKFLNMEDKELVGPMGKKYKDIYAKLEPGTYKDTGAWKDDPTIMDPATEEGRDFIDLAEKIENSRIRGLKQPGHSLAGFEPIKHEKATSLITDWMRANALGILGPRHKEGDLVKDPVTGKMVKIHLMSGIEAKKYFTGRNLTVGYDPAMTRSGAKGEKGHPGDLLNLEIPTIPRWVSYQDLRILFPDGVYAGDPEAEGSDTNPKQPTHGERIYVPYLHDAKTLPKMNWTPQQKAILAHRAHPDLLPGVGDKNAKDEKGNAVFEKLTDAQKEELYQKFQRATDPDAKGNISDAAKKLLAATTSIDSANIMNNWDILTPEQKEHVVKNSRNIVQHARATQLGRQDKDRWSHGMHNHGVGYSVNKATTSMPYLGVTQEQLAAIKKKYGQDIKLEAIEGVNRWFYGRKAATAIMKGNAQEATPFSTYGRTPVFVREKWYANFDSFAAIARIMLLSVLNDFKMGIYDPDVDLSEVKSDDIMKAWHDGHPLSGGKELRLNKIANLLDSLAQAQNDLIPPKRNRKFDAPITVQAGVDKEGKSIIDDNEITRNREELEAYNDKREKGQMRVAKNPKGLMTTAKGALGNIGMPTIVQSLRASVKKSLSPGDSELLTQALVTIGIEWQAKAILTAELDAKYASEQNPDGSRVYTDKEREELVDRLVNKQIAEKLRTEYPEWYSDMTDEEREAMLARVRGEDNPNAKVTYADFDFDKDNPNYINDFNKAMNDFWTYMLRNKPSPIPEYDSKAKEFVNTREKIDLRNFQKGHLAITPVEFIKAIQTIYNAAAKEATSTEIKNQIHQNLERWAPVVYHQLLGRSSNNNGESREEITKILKDAGMGVEDTSPIQPKPQPIAQPAVAAQPQMAANVVDNTVDNVLNKLMTNIGEPNFATLVNQLVSRTEDFSKSMHRKEIGEKIKVAYTKIHAIRLKMMIARQLRSDRTEMAAFTQLGTLYKKLIA
jgi:predicted Fe-S protein YdhL (DUF1289 family)